MHQPNIGSVRVFGRRPPKMAPDSRAPQATRAKTFSDFQLSMRLLFSSLQGSPCGVATLPWMCTSLVDRDVRPPHFPRAFASAYGWLQQIFLLSAWAMRGFHLFGRCHVAQKG